jgi:hypothetical protein
LCNVGNRFVFGGNYAQGHFHVRIGEIDGFGAFGCFGEVGEDEVDFAGTDVFDAVCGLGQDEFDFVGAAEQVFGQVFGDFNVKALVFAVGVNIAERRLVAEYADTDDAFFFDGGNGCCAAAL